ncbi:MAG: GIY-YIG nuclease family protein [Desulfuromonadaceae bacterium]|nr:GIY-YIG nuclease family protein [Desulfuromonadaceae bacterium]
MSNKPEAESQAKWHVYIIRCSDNSLYTGITTDIDRRFRRHAVGKGAKYFRGRTPQQVVYREENHSRSSAARREYCIKRMNRAEKELLVADFSCC